jgi:hypothetical protein
LRLPVQESREVFRFAAAPGCAGRRLWRIFPCRSSRRAQASPILIFDERHSVSRALLLQSIAQRLVLEVSRYLAKPTAAQGADRSGR